MRLKVGNLVRQSMLGLAITLLAVMLVFAAGDIAGPGNSTGEYKDDGASGTASGAPYYYNKTIEDAYGSTFEYGNRDSGFGTFTMGNHDTTLIAQWDLIHYAVTFDATAKVNDTDLCNTLTVLLHHVPKENGGVPYYRWYDVMDASNKTKFIGLYDADGNYTAGSGTVEQYTNINVPGGDPFGTAEATGTLEYNLRYDSVYQLFDNGQNESAIFLKIGYDLIGWSTRQPQTYEEMQEMAKWNVVGVNDVFDGANCPRISASDPQAGANTDGTVADLKIGNANVLLADSGKFKNLSWGLPNEYVNDTYLKVTLYAIWAPKQVTSKVYYTLQKEDGTYSLDTSDNANVLLADRSYSVIPTDTVADVVEEIANTGLFNGTWKTDGSTWTRRTIDDSRVYKYDGDTFHNLSYSVLDVQQTIYQAIPGEDLTLDSNANTVDKGSFFLDTTDLTIYIKVPRRKVEIFVYGMLLKNNNGYFYTQSKLKTDDGELFGTYSVKAKNASAYVETRDNPTPTLVDLADSTLENVYLMTLTAYAGQTVDITNVLETGKLTLGEYTYSYLGNSYGNGEFNLSYLTEGPKLNSRDIKITVGTGSMYVLLYFNKEEAPAKPLEVKWNEMTRNYHDPYGIGVDGAGYGGVLNATGPWLNIQWKNAEVGTGLSKHIYYMQIWLDNNAAGADKRDRLNILAMPSGGKLELHQMYNNKDLVVVRFENGITEAALQSWLRNQFAVILYTDPGDYTPANDRVKIFVTDVQGYNRNDTGEKTIYVDPGYVTVNNFYVPLSFEDGAHLMFDGKGPNGAILYWKYEYRERQQVQTGPEGHISAGDRGGHNYSENPWDYAHASYTMGIPSWITNKPGLQWAKLIRARADAYTFDTIDNKIIVAIDGTYVVWDGSNGRKHWDAGWTGTAGGHLVTFDLWAGDQSEANTGTAYNEDHGGELENMTVIWEYEVLIQKFSVIKFREDASVNTTEYTIPTQYPVVIQYDGLTAWKQDAGNTSDIYWSEVPGDNVNGFDSNWIFGMYSTDGGHDLNNNAAGSPEKYTKNLSTNVLRRYGYVWDGHWYTVYNESKVQKNAYDWLTNRLSGVKGGLTWNAGNNKLSLLKYNTQFGNISNPSGTYSYLRAGTYGNFYTMQESNIKYRFNSKGYVPVTTNEKSNGTAVTLDYLSMIQLWLQSGAEYRQYNINDRYTGNQTKSIPCRVITLYAARTVPIQYTVKYVSGGTSTFGGNTVPYSWDTAKSLLKGSINNTNSATLSNSDLAKSHALNAPASGVDTLSTNYGNWYRQQFVYDTPSKLSKVAFSRNDGDLIIDGESLDGYKFIGWTVYKDETGNNDNASYRKDDTKNSDKELMDTVDIKVNTKLLSYVDNGTQMKSGTASLLVTILNSTKKWNSTGASGEVEEYKVTEDNNEFFLADEADVENLLGVVLTSGDIGEVTKAKDGLNVLIPRVVYSDNFKWPEVVVYPNWLKEVNLTIDVDPKDDVDPGDSGKFGDLTTLIELKVAYGNDVMYNNTLYYPINLDRIFNNIDVLKEGTIAKGESWRGSFGFVKGDRESGNLAGPGGDIWDTWKDANGSNEIWNKTVVSTVKDKDNLLINTDYRFLGLLFSNKTTYPTSSNDISETIQNGSIRLPDGAITVGENEKALIDNGNGYKFYTHPRKYALLVYDTDLIRLDADGYNNILTKFFDDNRDKTSPYVGVDNSEGYLSTIDCYNNTTLYAVWEPIMTTLVDVNRTGYPSIKIGYPEKDRITGVEEFYVEIPSKSGTGMLIITGIDGNKPKDTADDKELWDTSDSYRTTLEYRYNDPFTEEIINLYKDPIASDKDFQTVLDKLNNLATWTANQRDDGTPQTPKITTPHSYQSWSFYLPLYLGTDEMNEASHGRFVFSPSKVYEVDIISSRYSYYYANYVPDSEKDDKYPDNETVIVRLGYKLEEANKPDHQDPDLNPTPTPDPGGPTPSPSPSPTPDPGEPTPTPSPTPTPTPSYPPDNPDGGNDGQSILDDLRVHVKLH